MQRQKKQIILLSITLANIIVFCVITALAFSNRELPSGDFELPIFPNEQTHSIQRSAAPSLSVELSWELSLGGSSNDDIKEVYSLNYFYIFGQTTSSNYDFVGADGLSTLFMARMTLGGELLSVSLFGTQSNDFYVNAAMSLNYFAVLHNSSARGGDYAVTLLSYDGSVYKTRDFGTDAIEEAKYITYFDGYIVVVAQYQDAAGKSYIKVVYLDEELNVIFDRRPSRTASLKFVCLLPYNSNTLLLVANAEEGLAGFSTLYKVRKDLAPEVFDQQKDTSHAALDCIPYSDGYLLLCKYGADGTAYIRRIARDLQQSSTVSLGSSAKSGRLISAVDGWFVHLSNQQGDLYYVSKSFAVSASIAQLNDIGEAYTTSISTVIVGTHNQRVTVLALVGSGVAMRREVGTLPSQGMAIAAHGSSAVVFGTVEGVNADVSVQYGMRDVWAAKLI